MNREGQENIRVTNLLQALEAELHELGRLAEMAQTSLSKALSRAADDPACHRDAQMLDLLTQRLYGMSGFLNHLAPSIPLGWEVNTSAAVKTLSLGALVDRLNGAPVSTIRPDLGELELF